MTRAKEGDCPLPLYWEDQVVDQISQMDVGHEFTMNSLWNWLGTVDLQSGHSRSDLHLVFPRALKAGLVENTQRLVEAEDTSWYLWRRIGGGVAS